MASSNGAAAAITASGLAGAIASATSTATRLTTSGFSGFVACDSSSAATAVVCLMDWKGELPSLTSSAERGFASGTIAWEHVELESNCEPLNSDTTFSDSVDMTSAGFLWGNKLLVPHLLLRKPLFSLTSVVCSACGCDFFIFSFRIGSCLGGSRVSIFCSAFSGDASFSLVSLLSPTLCLLSLRDSALELEKHC